MQEDDDDLDELDDLEEEFQDEGYVDPEPDQPSPEPEPVVEEAHWMLAQRVGIRDMIKYVISLDPDTGKIISIEDFLSVLNEHGVSDLPGAEEALTTFKTIVIVIESKEWFVHIPKEKKVNTSFNNFVERITPVSAPESGYDSPLMERVALGMRDGTFANPKLPHRHSDDRLKYWNRKSRNLQQQRKPWIRRK